MDIWLHYQTARITTESLILVYGQALHFGKSREVTREPHAIYAS